MDRQPRVLSLPYRSWSSDELDANRGRVGLRTLHDPGNPYLELIFVHGLMGDFEQTWMIENEKETFWPEWLSDDVSFSNMRIHTYGYQEPISNGKAPVDKLRDIGINLCSALESNNYIRGDAHNPIIFLAHSLGGIVVKAAVTHAKLNIKYSELYQRFHTIIFLATPHREAEDRPMLRSIVRACNTTSKNDVLDVPPNTVVVQDINNEFLPYSQNLRMYSFYENSADAIISQKRATMGLAQEMPKRVNTGHVNIARFRAASDPTYSSIKEILQSLVSDIQEELLNPEKVESHMRMLASYLAVFDSEDEDYMRRNQRKVTGSCDWLIEKNDFQQWRDREAEAQQIYWLVGEPGCGKSYISTHVISHLQERRCSFSFYFLKHGDIDKQSLGTLLKSIAFQMARTSANIRRSLLSMRKEDTFNADPSDYRAIWKQLFVQRVFRADPEKPQYWIVDALDEASNSHELLALLQSLPKGYRVFLTSRRHQELERESRRLEMKVIPCYVEKEDTLNDIRTYLMHNREDLHVGSEGQRETLIQRLVEKSNGSFLWTHLIVQELAFCWTDESIEAALNTVPGRMQDLYSRIWKKISRSRNRALARSIIRWVICAIRPLFVSELSTAFHLDTRMTLGETSQAVESICGPLVCVNDERVEVVHDTVRDFFFTSGSGMSEKTDQAYGFDEASTHEKLAHICLSFLNKTFRAQSRTGTNMTEDPFMQYASQNFSDHADKSAPAEESEETHNLVRALSEFFGGPVLFWIERLATRQELTTLTRTGKNIKRFATRRSSRLTHPQQSQALQAIQAIQEWADDLIHVATVFGKDLLKEPRSIHTVIPALCPARSRIHREQGAPTVGIEVVGLPGRHWSDRIFTTTYVRDYANAVACCEKFFAVSLRSPQIILYSATTCQEMLQIQTVEPIKLLEFARSKDWLAASGRRSLTVLNYETGEHLWTLDTESEIISLTMTEDDSELVAINRQKVMETFSIQKGKSIDSRSVGRISRQNQSPQQVLVSDELGLIALFHRNEELEIYRLGNLERPYRRIEYRVAIDTIAFNDSRKMLAMATFDGQLCTIDVTSMEVCATGTAYASHMAVSLDGKTLVVGCKNGDIQIHNSFTVWEPSALIRHIAEDSSRESDSLSTYTTARSQDSEVAALEGDNIDAFVEHHSGDYMFCAKDNGKVTVFETDTGKPKNEILNFGQTIIVSMAWSRNENFLAIGDNASTVRCYKVQTLQERTTGGKKKESWRADEVWKQRLPDSIRQVLFSTDGDLLLVSTETKEHVFKSQGGPAILTHQCDHAQTSAQRQQRWATFVKKKLQTFVEIQHGASHRVSWDKNYSNSLKMESIQLPECTFSEAETLQRRYHRVQIPSQDSQVFAAFDTNPNTPPLIWSLQNGSLREVPPGSDPLQFHRQLRNAATEIEYLIGIYRARLVFLNFDYWVCSVRIDRANVEEQVKHHFPIPHCWRKASRHPLCTITAKGDIVFAVDGDLAVVKHTFPT